MDVPTARVTIGRLFRSVVEFLESYGAVDVEAQIPEETRTIFQRLSDEYQFKLHNALKAADAVEVAHPGAAMDPDADPVRLDCENCGNFTMVLNEKSSTGYRCTFCENEEGDDLPVSCTCCGARMTAGDLETWADEDHAVEYRCYYCSGRYAAERDRY